MPTIQNSQEREKKTNYRNIRQLSDWIKPDSAGEPTDKTDNREFNKLSKELQAARNKRNILALVINQRQKELRRHFKRNNMPLVRFSPTDLDNIIRSLEEIEGDEIFSESESITLRKAREIRLLMQNKHEFNIRSTELKKDLQKFKTQNR